MKIMLDAGHGYDTPGKRSPDGMREYEFNRAVAIEARSLLTGYQNVEVFFAHSDDRDIPLRERTDLANRLKVNVYVSIHANAFGSGGWNSAGGIETFVHPKRPKEALELAEKVQRNLVVETGLSDRGVKTADFAVLRETNMTAILAECGFMTNQTEIKLLRSDVYRKKIARAIVNALVTQYKLVPKKVEQPKPVVPEPNVPGGQSKKVNVVTGALGEGWMLDILRYVRSQGWQGRIEVPKKGNPYFVIGYFNTGSSGLAKLENWLKSRKWHYTLQDYK